MSDQSQSQNAEARVPMVYEPPVPGISRRSFRLLLLLTLINTILMSVYVLGPGLNVFVRQQWDYLKRRQNERKLAAQQAAIRQAYLPAQQQCMDYLLPPSTLMYAEDSDGIKQLMAAGPVNHVCSVITVNRPSAMKAEPVGAANPGFTAAMPTTLDEPRDPFHTASLLHRNDTTLLYLHRCVGAAGVRMVAVYVSAIWDASTLVYDRGHNACNFTVNTSRHLMGAVLTPATATADVAVIGDGELHLIAGHALVTDPQSKAGQVTVDYTGQLRLFAGQPDPVDASVFHIPYSIDGVRGTIEGRLTVDDRLLLTPDPYLAEMEAEVRDHPFDVPSPEEHRATGQPR